MCKTTENIFFSALSIVLISALGFYIYMIAFRDPVNAAVTPEDIVSEISDFAFCALTKGDQNTVKRNLQIYEPMGEYVYFSSDSLMNVDELLILKTDNEDLLDTLEQAVERRLSAQKQNFKGYGQTQTELLENAVVEIKGNFFFYAVSENAEKWEEVFSASLRK